MGQRSTGHLGSIPVDKTQQILSAHVGGRRWGAAPPGVLPVGAGAGADTLSILVGSKTFLSVIPAKVKDEQLTMKPQQTEAKTSAHLFVSLGHSVVLMVFQVMVLPAQRIRPLHSL